VGETRKKSCTKRDNDIGYAKEEGVSMSQAADKVSDLREKMQEYIDNGVRLGWFIDPFEKRVFIYRPGQPVEILDNPVSVNGESVLSGFVLFLRELWS
jgi:Uma2 family endonuclease